MLADADSEVLVDCFDKYDLGAVAPMATSEYAHWLRRTDLSA